MVEPRHTPVDLQRSIFLENDLFDNFRFQDLLQILIDQLELLLPTQLFRHFRGNRQLVGCVSEKGASAMDFVTVLSDLSFRRSLPVEARAFPLVAVPRLVSHGSLNDVKLEKL